MLDVYLKSKSYYTHTVVYCRK